MHSQQDLKFFSLVFQKFVPFILAGFMYFQFSLNFLNRFLEVLFTSPARHGSSSKKGLEPPKKSDLPNFLLISFSFF